MIPFARPVLAAFACMAILTNSAYAGGFQFDECTKNASEPFLHAETQRPL